ncbi:MAG TPA: DNA polymerase III subunit gamma/tau [Lentisphaeria bacterium]|nr:MAG: DNA polymerase III, subunit gamma and tau [Lentisphaerae bacterium GWF2_49_21]HBC89054.1 DNA polymerase III subunit gamma/tau [Lentisphaeria bacterium]
MSEYQVIARKWRPQKFSEVIGQEHVIKTLQNELSSGRTAHAYLFVGPRGIGKTTIARIFAKALNCTNLISGEPCCKCPSCLSIVDGSCLDLIEMDAASHTGVDKARNLCEEAMYAPVSSRYKVYIIDEVHMLSANAWNALLKTVEEPPPHVKFLFATTEAHKVIGTIVSRCQRFDLKRISTKQISDTLARIAEAEKVRISRPAIEAIARAADGGMRDAQSLLDQMISFFSSDNAEISEEHVLSVFGLTGESEMENLVSAILGNDKTSVVKLIHSIAGHGKNLEKLFEDLLFCLRGVELCKILDDPATVLETGEESVARFKELGKDVDLRKIERLLEQLSSAGRALRDVLNKQVFIESTILKAMRYSHAVQIEELISKINSLSSGGSLNIPNIPAPPSQPAEKKSPLPARQPEIRHQVVIKEPQSSYDAPEIIVQKESEPAPSPPPPVPAAPKPVVHNPLPAPQVQENLGPEAIWHRIISEIDHTTRPLLKIYMQEGMPEKWENETLTVLFDQEFEEEHVAMIIRDIHTINNCLHRITGKKNASVHIQKKTGITSPHEMPHQNLMDLAEVKKKVRENKYVQTVTELFNGEIVDVRG